MKSTWFMCYISFVIGINKQTKQTLSISEKCKKEKWK
jgi:hypothetical protein